MKNEPVGNGPLKGVRVIELSSIVMGPFAAQVLGDLGADVVKIEPPGGDPLRTNGPGRNPGMSALFLHTNRNKRSVVLDLKSEAGRRSAHALIEGADVLLHSNRADAMRRLGLAHDDLTKLNPTLVVCAIAGFGDDGIYAGRPALDDLVQAHTALPELVRRVSGTSHYVPVFLARMTALFAVQAVIGALIHRQRCGAGGEVQVPMFETLAHLVLSDHLYGKTFEPALAPAGYVRALTPDRRPYKTQDAYLCANIYNDTHWRRFCDVVGEPGFKDDPRFVDMRARTENFGELCAFITAKLSQRTTAEWLAILDAADIPAMPLHSIDTLMRDPHLRDCGFLRVVEHPTEGRLLSPGIPTRWSVSQPAVRRHAPSLGEHTQEVLAEVRTHPRRAASSCASGARTADLPLSGIRVLDLSSVVLGPYATLLMAEQGADVIKLEPPKGDGFRSNGPARHPGMSAMFLNVNRNKRSVSLDLKRHEGKEALLRLVKTADVLVFNVRPAAMARLGLTYEAVAAANPSIIYCSAVGYGQAGPYAAKPAYDELIQGAVALPWLEQQISGRPQYAPLLISDRTTGLTLLYSVLAALYYRQETGRGQAIEVPMFETMAQLVLADHLMGATFDPAVGPPGYRRALARNRGPFRTRDGYLSVSTIQDKHWKRFCAAVDRPDLAEDRRYKDQSDRVANSDSLCEAVSRILSGRTNADWLGRFDEAEVPAAASSTLEDLISDPHLRSRHFIQLMEHPTEGMLRVLKNPVTSDRFKWTSLRPAPRLGEHTAEILSEAGYSPREIALLSGRA
jgi:crotonobetainyl-CoA:carnitine CoA-transferase CaiB-like acyl-CoA transferase